MADTWLRDRNGGVVYISEDTKTLAVHVLAYAGLQKLYPFRSIAKDNENRQPTTNRVYLSIILRNIFVKLVLPPAAFFILLLPAKWKYIAWAITEFRE